MNRRLNLYLEKAFKYNKLQSDSFHNTENPDDAIFSGKIIIYDYSYIRKATYIKRVFLYIKKGLF